MKWRSKARGSRGAPGAAGARAHGPAVVESPCRSDSVCPGILIMNNCGNCVDHDPMFPNVVNYYFSFFVIAATSDG